VQVNGGGSTGCMGALTLGGLQNGGKVIGVIHERFVVDGLEYEGGEGENNFEMQVVGGEGLGERKRRLLEGSSGERRGR
jgi:predicted Rossmann-fold nucleotide-binding protein